MENIDVLVMKAGRGDTGSLAHLIHYVGANVAPKTSEDSRFKAWAWYRLGQLERILDGTGNWKGYILLASATKMRNLQNWALRKAVAVHRSFDQIAA